MRRWSAYRCGLSIRQVGFEPWHCYLVAVWLWVREMTSLTLRILACKIWIKSFLFTNVLWELNEINMIKVLNTVPSVVRTQKRIVIVIHFSIWIVLITLLRHRHAYTGIEIIWHLSVFIFHLIRYPNMWLLSVIFFCNSPLIHKIIIPLIKCLTPFLRRTSISLNTHSSDLNMKTLGQCPVIWKQERHTII